MQSVDRPKSKNAVKVGLDKGKIRLTLPAWVSKQVYGVTQKRFYPGLEDSPENWLEAEKIARRIQNDIEHNEFDQSFKKYEPRARLTVVESIKPKTAIKLVELWQKYTAFKWNSASPSTRRMYGWVERHLTRLPSTSVDDAITIRDHITANLSSDVAKRLLMHLNAACNWGIESRLLKVNPFQGMAKKVPKPKSKRVDEDNDINPFTREERDRIIQSFENDTRKGMNYRKYAPFVKFLFFTGCRPSEAIALQWGHIGDDFITFQQAVVMNEKNQYELKPHLKTQEYRKFRINNQLREILDSIRISSEVDNESLVFPSPKNGFIDFHNFRNRAWKSILEELGIKYRKPYQTRHTFITLCLESGVDAKDVAKWTGNSASVIYKHYAGNKRDLIVPEL